MCIEGVRMDMCIRMYADLLAVIPINQIANVYMQTCE